MTGKESRRKEKSFWDWTGEYFPSLTGAPSTRYYFECEKTLFESFCPDLKGKKVLKTDLWDEAKNTRILCWAADQGAQVFGIDISSPTVREAADNFRDSHSARLMVNDVRWMALRSDSVDVIYSMGTIEHFPEYRQALRECFRILKPGGMIFMGVPNRWDPFLRPLMVKLMQWAHLYSYGRERSFSRRALARMMRETGFETVDMSGILFMPGILRIIDLFLHVQNPSLTKITAPLIAPFAWLFRKVPALRRHGYLICSISRKPPGES